MPAYTHSRPNLTLHASVCYVSRVVMQSDLRLNLMRSGRLRHGIAIFLLAFAFFDLMVVDMLSPELCGDEQAPFSSACPETADESAVTRTHDSQPSQDPHQSPIDEDCFCCCSHIIPSPNVDVAALNCPPRPDDPAITSLPSSPPRGAFHPPRHS